MHVVDMVPKRGSRKPAKFGKKRGCALQAWSGLNSLKSPKRTAGLATQVFFGRDLWSRSSLNARASSVLITACRLTFSLAARSSRSRSMP